MINIIIPIIILLLFLCSQIFSTNEILFLNDHETFVNCHCLIFRSSVRKSGVGNNKLYIAARKAINIKFNALAICVTYNYIDKYIYMYNVSLLIYIFINVHF